MNILENDHQELINISEFQEVGYQYTIMYMSRIHSQAEFLFSKIASFENKIFSKYEVSEIFEAFTIKTICDWEWYNERMICECLRTDTSKLSEHLDLDLPKRISIDEGMGYLAGLGYFDLKSASNLKTIAKKILVTEKNPFQNINSEAKMHIDDFYSLRNYVAHKSKKSKKALLNIYKKYNQNDFIEVGEFLLSKRRKEDNTVRFQDFGGSFWLASFNILEFLYPNIYKCIVK